MNLDFHAWFGTHTADLKTSHWERGNFVSRCTRCGRPMIKLPGTDWKLGESRR
jgi:hypothetical protein